MKELEKTYSVCPVCFQEGNINKITANIIEEDEKVWIIKICKKHGSFKEIYFGDIQVYKKWMRYKSKGKPVLEIKTSLFDEPKLYKDHLSQTILTNLIVTNRCNQSCTYCYMNTGKTDYIYEPTLDQLKGLLLQARQQKPVGSKALQITGGEPTLRDDLLDIIRLAKDTGFEHVQIQTNGLKLAGDVEYCQKLKKERVNTIYLNFNGVTPTTNPRIEQNTKAIENLRKANIKIVLVPTLINGYNIHEAGKIIRFGLDNIDIIRGIHFQPLFFCGQSTVQNESDRQTQRVDYIKLMEVIEKEFNGLISRDDFYPFSFISPFSQLIETMTREPQIHNTVHPGCGGSTYLFMKDEKPIPITRFAHVETVANFFDEHSKKKGPLRKLRIAAALVRKADTFFDENKSPKYFNIKQLGRDAAIIGDNYALREIGQKSLFVGVMWHQDIWNLNIDRLQYCGIHYTTFEGMIPFCMYHTLGYGEKIQKKYSVTI